MVIWSKCYYTCIFFQTQNQHLMAESLANFSASSSARYRLFPQFPTEFSNRKWKITLSTESFQGRYTTTATISDQKDTVCYPLSDRAADTPHSLLHNVKNALHCVLNSVKFFGRAHPVSPLIYIALQSWPSDSSSQSFPSCCPSS